MTEYTLSQITTIVGTFKVTLFSGITDLSVPTSNTILEIGDLTENVDLKPGLTEISHLKLKLRDDYSDLAHPEGFWFRIFNETVLPEIRIYLDEGNGDTFYFWGTLNRSESSASELYVGSSYVRVWDISLISIIAKIDATTVADLVTEILTHEITTGLEYESRVTKCVKARDIFSSILAKTFSQTFNTNDTTYIWDGTTDEFLYWDGSSWLNFDNVYIATEIDTWPTPPPPGHNYIRTKYFKLDESLYWPTLYDSTLRLIADLCHNFGFVLRHFYGNADGMIDSTPANNKHRFQLIQRGHAYSATIDFGGKEKASSFPLQSSLTAQGVRTFYKGNESVFYWMSIKYQPGTGEPPKDLSFDIDYPILFMPDGTADPAILCKSNGTTFTRIKVWDRVINSYFEPSPMSALRAITQYYYHRFLFEENWTVYPKMMYKRTYGKIAINNGTTTSHRNMCIMRRTGIANGGTVKNFYANRVTKNASTAELEIEWIEE